MRTLTKKLLSQVRRSLGITDIANDIQTLRNISTQEFIYNELNKNPQYSNKRHLNRYEYKVFSQFGEDGIISEIFNRIGTTNKHFVEIGAEDGRENNTSHLLINGWKGCWVEGNKKHTDNIQQKFASLVTSNTLKVVNEFVTKENITDIFKSVKIPVNFDFLSVDIDGNDYWILKDLEKYSPRVICVEYNTLVGSRADWIMPYDPSYILRGSIHFGASLVAFDKLLSKRGYVLVGCSFAGTNAFFVKKNLVKKKFLKPFTPKHFYQPQRFFLYQKSPYEISDDFLRSIQK